VDKEGVWNTYKKYIRRDVRKAEKSGVTVRSGHSIEDVRLFYDLYLSSMKRNRAAAKYPLQWFKVLCEGGPKEALGEIRFAVLEQEPIAGVVLVHSTTATHYFHNGSRSESLKYCPNELLVHRAIEEAIERGAACFDFMGSDREDLSLIHFKEKWGSRSLNVHTYLKDYHPFKSKMWEQGKTMAASPLGSKVAGWFRRRLP
jgi:lipid II:glycine glycyltransferase (peptidoglycan interpeptide bridge formation enzyme)